MRRFVAFLALLSFFGERIMQIRRAVPWMVLFSLGCTLHWEPNFWREPAPVPENLQKHVTIDGEEHRYLETMVEDHGDYRVYEVSVVVDGEVCTRVVWYRCAAGGPRPVDFIWPILVGGKMPVAKLLAANVFVPLGIDAVIIRQEQKLFSGDSPRPPGEFQNFHEEMLRDLLRAVRWARTRSELDPGRFGMTGTSYGGIMTAGSIPFTPDFVSYKIIMGGGDLAEILEQTAEHKVVKWREALLRQMQAELVRDMERRAGKDYYARQEIYQSRIEAEARNMFRRQVSFSWDPLYLAKYGDPRRIAMVITLFDRCVPTANQMKLWHSLGRPEALFVTTGHYTLILAYLQVRSFIGEVARKHYKIARGHNRR